MYSFIELTNPHSGNKFSVNIVHVQAVAEVEPDDAEDLSERSSNQTDEPAARHQRQV